MADSHRASSTSSAKELLKTGVHCAAGRYERRDFYTPYPLELCLKSFEKQREVQLDEHIPYTAPDDSDMTATR